jgi:mycothiol system anti-sigma-R factor
VSCGKPHGTDCGEVLAQLYLFIDHELDDASAGQIQHHLDECAPCLHHHELDILVRRLVARSCTEPAPAPLRDRVLLSIRDVVHTEVRQTTVTETRVTETRHQGQGSLGGDGSVSPF